MSVLNGQSLKESFYEFIPYNFIGIRSDRIDSPLLNLAGVGIILSKERLMQNIFINVLISNGDIKARGDYYLGKKRIKIGDVFRETFYQHPPSTISLPAQKSEITFGIEIDPSRWNTGGDGATFMILTDDAGKQKIVFARHIDPIHNQTERRWLDYNLAVPDGKLSFITLPGDNFENDWAGWGELRSSAVDKDTRYKLLDDKNMYIYRNLSAMPRAFPVKKVIVASEEKCGEMLGNGLDFRNEACIENSGVQRQEAEGGLSGDAVVDWRRVASDRSEVDVESSGSAMVVVTETYYPGWRAIMENGVELKIHPADVMFRAVEIPPGKHKITFIYKPACFKIGLWTTLVSIIMMVFLIKAGEKPVSTVNKTFSEGDDG